MPLDNPEVAVDLRTPNLKALSWALRNLKVVKPTFWWRYSVIHEYISGAMLTGAKIMPDKYGWCLEATKAGCGTAGCAAGLAQEMWPYSIGNDMDAEDLACVFKIPQCVAERIFWWSGDERMEYENEDERIAAWNKVTPEIVADRIDAYLSGKPILR